MLICFSEDEHEKAEALKGILYVDGELAIPGPELRPCTHANCGCGHGQHALPTQTAALPDTRGNCRGNRSIQLTRHGNPGGTDRLACCIRFPDLTRYIRALTTAVPCYTARQNRV